MSLRSSRLRLLHDNVGQFKRHFSYQMSVNSHVRIKNLPFEKQ